MDVCVEKVNDYSKKKLCVCVSVREREREREREVNWKKSNRMIERDADTNKSV